MFNLGSYYYEYGGKFGSYFRRNIFVKIGSEDFDASLKKILGNCSNTDIYRCVYAYEDKDKINDCRLYGPLYFDLDGDIDNNFDGLKAEVFRITGFLEREIGLGKNEIELYFSGAKGFHIVVPPDVLGIEPSTNLNEIYKSWANYLFNTYDIKSIDLRIYDRKRLFRLPGSINSKTGLYKTKLTEAVLRSMTAEDILVAAANPLNSRKTTRQISLNKKAAVNFYIKSQNFYKKNKDCAKSIKPVILPKEKKELLPCVRHILENGIEEGNRNNTLSILSSALIQSGYTLEETLDAMHSWNELNEPPLSAREIEATTRSSYSMALSGRHYGCSAMQEYGFCTGGNCSVKEGRERLDG